MEIQHLLTPELKAQIGEQLAAERKVWEDRITALEGSTATGSAETKSAYESLVKRIDGIQAVLGKAETESMKSDVVGIAQRIFDSDQLKEWKDRAKHIGRGATIHHKGSIWEGWGMEHKDITSPTITAPSLGLSARLPDWVFAGVRRLRVADLIIRHTPVTDGAVNFVKENAWTSAAYPQTEGQAKGHSNLSFSVVQTLVKTLAHYIKASRQVLDDIGQLRSAIDFKLLLGLKDIEDTELLRGDGTGDHLLGLMLQAAAFDTSKHATTDNDADTLSEAMETIEAANHTATGIVVNPVNWRRMTRMKDTTNRYLLGGPATIDEPRLWGLPVAASNGMPIDQFLVGDFVAGAQLFTRMDSVIDISTENEDDFIKNMVTIRAEERLALAVFRSDYFVHGYLDGATHI